jgi:iron(III) transport system substrate-binding protein
MKKIVSSLTLVLGLLMLFVSFASAANTSKIAELYEAAKKEGEVVVAQNWAAEVLKPLTDSFQKVFPAVKFTMIRVTPAEQAQRVITESRAKRLTMDVGCTDVGAAMPVIERDLLVNQDYTGTGVDPKDIALNGGGVFGREVPAGIIYNTKLVAQKDIPKNWEDLLDPKWQGKIAQSRTGGGMQGLSMIWDESRIESFLKALAKQNVMILPTGFAAVEKVAMGEAAIMGAVLENVVPLWQKGAPVDVAPVNPVHNAGFYFWAVKNSPHPNAAKLFLLWLGSPEAKKGLAEAGWGRVSLCGPTPVEKMTA